MEKITVGSVIKFPDVAPDRKVVGLHVFLSYSGFETAIIVEDETGEESTIFPRTLTEWKKQADDEGVEMVIDNSGNKE